MINSIIRKTKKIKLNDIITLKNNNEKNVFRSNFVFNFQKFKNRKWKFQRSYKIYSDSMVFRRFSPNLTYIPNYNRLINKKIDVDNIKINKYGQLLSYKSKVALKRRLLGFFLMRKSKLLKKFLVFRHMTTHFNVFDTNYEVLLLRLGFVKSMKEARRFIRQGVLKINNHVITQTRHLNELDYVSFSTNIIKVKFVESKFQYRLKKYRIIETNYSVTMLDFLELKMQYYEKYKFLGILPFISPVNYRTLNFIYFNTLMKNQWNYFVDFYIAKKFLQYGR